MGAGQRGAGTTCIVRTGDHMQQLHIAPFHFKSCWMAAFAFLYIVGGEGRVVSPLLRYQKITKKLTNNWGSLANFGLS